MRKATNKIHLVNLFKWRSVVALIACAITILFTLGSVAYRLLTAPTLEQVRTEFEWFTTDSNLLTAFAALMILPFAVEGIKRKRMVYPKWLFIIHYAGTICTSLTLVFTVFIISWYNPQLAFGGANFFLHTICPLAVLISFFMVESNHSITKLDVFHGLIPFIAYSLIYFYSVVIAQTWEDHYMLNTFFPFYVSIPLMYILAFIIASIIRYIHTFLQNYRQKKLKSIWENELDAVTIKIDIYSLGIHAGLHQGKEDVSIPYDILEEVGNKFDIKMEDLVDAYMKGVIEGFKEKQSNHQ